MHEGVVTLGIERKQSLVEQHVDRLTPGALDHELGASFTKNRCRIINELTSAGLNSQVDAALRIGRRSALRNCSAKAF